MNELLLYLTIGLGACDKSGDWCNDPVGTFAITQEVYKRPTWTIDLNATHYSGVDGDEFRNAHGGHLGGDYGVNVIMLRFNKVLGRFTIKNKEE